MLAPFTQPVFAAGVSLYLITQGLVFAAYSALILELIGPGGRSAATRFTLYNAAGNAPVAYMTWLDGQGYKRFGPRGLLGTDALSNLLAAAIFLFLIRRTLFAGEPTAAVTK
jgi:MFS transporter, PAT family, beta-lactamase induction signal transducer AmpG